MDLKELKVMAYDTMAQIEFLQSKFKQINEEIAKQSQEQQKKIPVEKKVEIGDPQPWVEKDEPKVEEIKEEEKQ
jgi:hypothetical protein